MNTKIVELMKASQRDLDWLQNALQSALELELSTLPPYLCGLWSLPDRSAYPATQILSIVMQEMLHFGLACNMLSATGKQPEVLKGYGQISYPGPLPGGVVPKCEKNLIPCDPNFKVMLGFPDFKAFTLMCAQIEFPEDAVPKPTLRGAPQTFPSIGEFYDAVLEAFAANDAKIPYDVTNQRAGLLGLYVIDNLTKATTAIQRIQQQGEGGNKNPYYDGNQLSHFYAFGELYHRKKYVFNAATETGDWTGDAIQIPDNQISNMTPVPLNGYPAPPPEVIECDQIFTTMLTQLESAWSGGGGTALGNAVASMRALRKKATALLAKKINRTDAAGIYGPQFRIAAAGPTGGPGGGPTGGGSAVPVSYAKDIKPLFRTIDVQHMQPMGILLDDYTYMSDATDNHANASAVLDVLSNHVMPPGGPFWPQDKLDLFAKWMSDGYKP